MTLHTSRRRVTQMALVTAAAATMPRSRAAAHQATPAAAARRPSPPPRSMLPLDRLDGLIEDGMTQTGVPGTAVAVVYDDEVVYERGFGVRELGKPEPITPETVFQIASLSKPLSSTLVAAVVGDGMTTWDATIGSLEPGFALSDPWVSDQVTIRDMLCHRSGLPAYSGDPLVCLLFATIATSACDGCATTPWPPPFAPPGPTPIWGSAPAPTRRRGRRSNRGRTWPRRGCSHRWG